MSERECDERELCDGVRERRRRAAGELSLAKIGSHQHGTHNHTRRPPHPPWGSALFLICSDFLTALLMSLFQKVRLLWGGFPKGKIFSFFVGRPGSE